jgi:pyridoxine 5'-phosphate synthase PdxJ
MNIAPTLHRFRGSLPSEGIHFGFAALREALGRPDARHIRADDVVELAELLKSWPNREFNVEGNPFHNLT